MADRVLHVYDWVPEFARGHVRDLRIRWALEEAGLPYEVVLVPFKDRLEPAHLAQQPFGQVPWLTEGGEAVFESGAILLHLAQQSDVLLPPDARAKAVQWLFAALNSVEGAFSPWTLMKSTGAEDGKMREHVERGMRRKLDTLERELASRDWIAGPFSVADIALAAVMRFADRSGAFVEHPACAAYLARATDRPAFKKALADQLALYTD